MVRQVAQVVTWWATNKQTVDKRQVLVQTVDTLPVVSSVSTLSPSNETMGWVLNV